MAHLCQLDNYFFIIKVQKFYVAVVVESSDEASLLWQPWSNFSDGKEGRFVPELVKSDFARPFASAIAGNFTSAKPIDIDILR